MTDKEEPKDEPMLSILVKLYGPRLRLAELSNVLKMSTGEIRNQICAGTFPIRTGKTRQGRSAPRYADVRDVAKYLDETRPKV